MTLVQPFNAYNAVCILAASPLACTRQTRTWTC